MVVGAKHSHNLDSGASSTPEEARAPAATNVANASPLQHGLYQFKQGFGGQLVQYASAYDAVFSRWQYALYARAVTWRRGGLG